MKTHTTLTIETELLQKAKRLGINISGCFGEYLEAFISKNSDDLEGINIKLEKIEEKKLIEKITKLQASLKATQEKIRQYEEKQEERETERLEKEKKEIENQSKCMNCGSKESAKFFLFSSGKVCKSCYMNANGVQFKKWGEILK